ncbi:MAG: hypothetical protein [Bacteriophage sp.]|jgi:hypothetical protein|nr:MAG: hypothetical protein [Bacteriophage sp.]
MSLNKIGKATTLAKALDSFKLGGSISDTISSLRAFGNVNDAAKYLAKNRGSLPDATSIWMLQQAYGKNSMVEETMQSELSKNQIVQNESIGKSAGLFASFKNVGSGIATVFKSIAPMMIPLIIGAAGIKAGKMLWDNVLTDNAAQKNLQESVQKYKTEKSDLDNLQSQKETNKQRVYELRAKSNRTSAEDNELNNLLNEDSILDTQIGLKKRTVTSAQKQQALDAKKALEKRTFQGELFGKSPYPVYQDTNIGYAQKLMSGLEDEKQARKDVLNNKEWSSERKEAELKAKDKTIASYETELADVMSDISSNAQDLYDEDGNLIDKKNTQDLANNINDLFKAYSMLTNSSDYVSDKMDNIFALSKFSNLKDKLIEAGKSGGTDAIKDLISQTKDLDEAMSNAGIDADDLADGIMAIADPDAKNLEGIKDNLKDIFGKKYSFFKDKNDEDIEGFWDYLQDNNLNPEKMKWGKKDISDNWEDYLNSKKSTEIVDDTTFASRFKNSAEDTATDLDTITDNFQTDMSNIKSSMDSIKSGTFQNSDVTDLIQQFPELATETDNLQQGLQNLAFDKASDAIGKIRDSVKDVTDPKQLAAADKYIQSIMDTMDLSGFDLDKKTVKNLLTNNFTGKNNGPITLDQGFTVSKLMDLYGNDELALQAIVKLSADPSMADADWETWKSKIEDTKVQIQLDTSAKNLDNLSKELTRLQTDASDQQTRLNNKSAYNMKATASDYTNLIENGDKQIENLNNQIQEYQNSIDALKNSKGLSPLSDEDNEQIKQWQDQIQASQMSIENMKASQADWTKTAFNLPVTDMQNTVTALTSAISEMQTETGLTSDTMDSLRTQFSDLKDAHVDNVFDRTAKGLKINTERMKDYLEQQNEFMNSDFANRIKNYQNELAKGNEKYTAAGLEDLKNLQAQYFAQYQEAAKQFSNFQAMVNADNLATEGNEYTTAQNYLKNAKDLYDKGLVGTPQFKAAAKYFSQNGFEDADNFIENYNKLKNYYTDDASGPKRFLDDLEAKGLATYQTLEDGSKQWMYSFTDTQDAADAMGMSLESFQSMFGRLGDYGFTNNFVSSLEEGALKTDEINDKLVAAQEKYAKMKARGATQSALDDQQAVIDDLESQQQGIVQATSDYASGAAGRKVQDLKEAKSVIDDFSAKLKEVGEDSDLGRAYIDTIQKYADENGIKLNNFEVDEASYNQMLESYESKARGSQIKHFQDVNEGIESGNTGDYSDSDVELITKIKDAQEQRSEALQNVIDAVNSLDKDQWNEANQIELGNGAYESEDQGIRNVEDALQGLSDQFGLTKEQATALLPALEALGVVNIDPNVDMTGLDELDQATQDGMASLRQMQADGNIKLSFDVDSSTEGLSVDKLQSQISELEHIKVNFDVDSSEYKAIQSMIDQRDMQMHVQIAVDKTGDIDKLLSLKDEELAQKAELDVDVNTEEGKAKIDELRSSLESLSGDSPAISVKIDETQFQALTKEQQGQGTVTFKPEHSEVDAYLAEEKESEGKVKWSNETGLVDVYAATEHYAHGTVHWGNDISAVKTSFTATGTVNWTNTAPPAGKSVPATGTFKASATGSAYNVLNMIPAHAQGTNVAIDQDGPSLVNEVGINGHSESIVRDGIWSLIPGGAHIENLKKGDIIFSATQTDALLKHGAIQGHARAYAQGTVSNTGIMRAYARAGNGSGAFQGGAASVKPAGSGNSGSSNLQHAIEDNTDALSNNSDTTSSSADKVDEALENAIKKLKDNAMDWIEVAMDRLGRITSKYTDYAESDYSHYTRSQKYYDKAIASTDKEIKAAKEGAAKYKAQAEKVAADSEVSKYLTAALKKKVQDGTIDVESLSANQKAAVEAYKEYYDKYLDATQTYREKKVQRLDLAKAKVDNVYDSYDVIVGKREAAENYWNAKAENRVAHGKNQKVGSIYYKDLQKQVTYAKSQKSLMSSEEKKVRKRMAEYLKVNGRNVKDKAYQEMKKQLIELQTSEVEMDTHIQELNQTIQDTRENIKQWAVDRWERAGAKQDAIINYKLVTDKADRQIQEKDYTERIKTANREILALDNLRKEKAEYYDMHFSSMNNEEAQKYLEELAQIDEQIMNLASDVEEFKNKIMELRWKPFDDLQNDLSNLITEYQNAQKLLGDSDSFYNDDGSFTTNGLTNILLTQESIDTTKDKIANYRVALDKLDEQYKNGCYSAEEYKAKQQDLLKSLQQESATLADLKQNLLDMYTTQVTKENDLLQENIDKRKEALDAKEKYYDYDKTLKKKTKDINTLKAQIAALEGTSNAASKARLEKLRAELADAEDDMADTMHQHEVDMKNTGYENFSNEANKALDNTLDAVKKNAAFQEAIIGNMLDTVTADYDSTYNHLHDVMDQYGMKVSQVFDANISKVADFNREAGKAADIVNKINTSYVPGTGNTKADTVVKDDLNRNNGSDNAGNEKPGTMGGTTYSLKLNASEIYLTYSHLKYSLKATWSPSKPEHSDIEWKSSDESIAKVSSDGTVRGVSAGLGKNGLMSRDESKTRKCIITANGGPGLATAECIVHIMPDSHYEAIKGYAERAGKLETSGNNLRDSMEYAYKNGAFRSNQSSTAVEGFQKAYLKDWFNALPDRPNGATDVPSGISQLAGYFYSKGKQVTRNDMQKLADILEIKTPGVGSYDTWGGTLKNKILKAYKAYGFSKGGVVRNGIPASILDMIGGDALIPRGDSVLIGANPGETVLTKEFTDQLKPTVATLNAFNEMMAKPLTPILPSSNGDTNVNSECNITINVDSINNEQDIKKLAYQIGDIITERNKRDWKKVR